MSQKSYFYAVGKRKTSVATIRLFPDGKGDITVNDASLSKWIDTHLMNQQVLMPLELLGLKKDFDIVIRTGGGGKYAQAQAIMLGIARALVKRDSTYREQLKSEGLLTRDPRKKERKKPGLRKARRAPQWSKR